MMTFRSRQNRQQRDIGEQQADDGRDDLEISTHGVSPLTTAPESTEPNLSALWPVSLSGINLAMWWKRGGTGV
jgi:hypothetical protein